MSVTWPIDIRTNPPGFAPPELTLTNDQVLVLTWNGSGPVKITFVAPQPDPMPTLAPAPFWISQCECNSKGSPFDSPGMDFTDVPAGDYEIEADDGGVGRMIGKLTVTKPGNSEP